MVPIRAAFILISNLNKTYFESKFNKQLEYFTSLKKLSAFISHSLRRRTLVVPYSETMQSWAKFPIVQSKIHLHETMSVHYDHSRLSAEFYTANIERT